MSTSQKMIECDVMEKHVTLIGFHSKRSFIRNLSIKSFKNQIL